MCALSHTYESVKITVLNYDVNEHERQGGLKTLKKQNVDKKRYVKCMAPVFESFEDKRHIVYDNVSGMYVLFIYTFI